MAILFLVIELLVRDKRIIIFLEFFAHHYFQFLTSQQKGLTMWWLAHIDADAFTIIQEGVFLTAHGEFKHRTTPKFCALHTNITAERLTDKFANAQAET